MHRIGAKKKVLPVCNSETRGGEAARVRADDFDPVAQCLEQVDEPRRLRGDVRQIYEQNADVNMAIKCGALKRLTTCFAAPILQRE